MTDHEHTWTELPEESEPGVRYRYSCPCGARGRRTFRAKAAGEPVTAYVGKPATIHPTPTAAQGRDLDATGRRRRHIQEDW